MTDFAIFRRTPRKAVNTASSTNRVNCGTSRFVTPWQEWRDDRSRRSLAAERDPTQGPGPWKMFWALREVSFTLEIGRGRRDHRPERIGQVDAAENPQPDYASDEGKYA